MSNRQKVLLTDHAWPGVEVERGVLAEAGFQLVEVPESSGEEVQLELAEDVSAIMTCWAPVRRPLVEHNPRLRAIVRMGVGLDNIDLQAAADHGCIVANVPDYCMEEVSDHVVALVHAWARGIVVYDRDVRAGNWSPGRFPLRRVSDISVGIIGLGRIGRHTAAKLGSLGCRVLGFDVNVDQTLDGLRIATRERLLADADVVTLHVPLVPETRHLVDEEFLAQMRRGALLVNASRGGIVDTAALTDGLRGGRPGAAALDVLESEPEVPEDLLALESVILTPHVAFSSDRSVFELRKRAAEEVVAVLSGDAPRNPVKLPLPAT